MVGLEVCYPTWASIGLIYIWKNVDGRWAHPMRTVSSKWTYIELTHDYKKKLVFFTCSCFSHSTIALSECKRASSESLAFVQVELTREKCVRKKYSPLAHDAIFILCGDSTWSSHSASNTWKSQREFLTSWRLLSGPLLEGIQNWLDSFLASTDERVFLQYIQKWTKRYGNII